MNMFPQSLLIITHVPDPAGEPKPENNLDPGILLLGKRL